MRTGLWVPLGVAVVVLAACGSDDEDSDTGNSSAEESADPLAATPTCDEWTERDVTAEEVEYGCRDEDFLAGTATHDCTDGRVLYWNDRVWGYVGEPAHEHKTGVEQIAPAAERESCGV